MILVVMVSRVTTPRAGFHLVACTSSEVRLWSPPAAWRLSRTAHVRMPMPTGPSRPDNHPG